MKKIILLLVLVSFYSVKSRSQEFVKGSVAVNGGIGLFSISHLFDDNFTTWPLFYVSGEYGVYDIEDIGVLSAGGFIGIQHEKFDIVDLSWTNTYIAVRGNIHINELIDYPKLDVYGGLALGYQILTEVRPNFAGDFNKHLVGDPLIGLYMGSRYFVTENLALVGEIGWDVSWLKIGISYQL